MAKFKLSSFSLNLPFGIGGVTVSANEAQVRAAWSLYVEYSTRIATQPLPVGSGSAREALSSLHSLFGTTRQILRDEGAAAGQGPESVGALAIRLLNVGVRPFLLKWHTQLSAYEEAEVLRQQAEIGAQHRCVIDEGGWGERDDFYRELEALRVGLLDYVGALAKLAGVTEAHLEEDRGA